MIEHTLTAPAAIAFTGVNKITSGSLLTVALACKSLLDRDANAPLLVLEYLSARIIELDLRGSESEITKRLATDASISNTSESYALTETHALAMPDLQETRGRGRPKLGVMAREITLLPRHWQWLAEQPGGASVTLRKLVEHARHANVDKDILRVGKESAYRFISTLAGDFAGFEEASRALFANEPARFAALVSEWPNDVRAHALKLANRAFEAARPALKNQAL